MRVSISILSRLISEKQIVTSFDLKWLPCDPLIVSCTRIITDVVSGHYLQSGFGWFMQNWKHFHITHMPVMWM